MNTITTWYFRDLEWLLLSLASYSGKRRGAVELTIGWARGGHNRANKGTA